jgi:uncharacterized phage-associated protein
MPSTLNIPTPVRKSTQALNYFARLAASGAPRPELNKLKALKLLFFADRYHIRKYGRSVTNSAYFAMAKGPVASEAKHVAEDAKRLDPRSRSYARRFVRQKGDTFDYASVAEVDRAVLSKTDIEALNFAWGVFGHYSKFQLCQITHHYPEWKRHARTLQRGTHRRVPMDYADFFEEPDAGYNPCHELSRKDREIARELYVDSQAVAKLWE